MDQKQNARSNYKRKFNKDQSRKGSYDPKKRLEAKFTDPKEHESRVRRQGFSEFQLRLVFSILNDAIAKHKSLDRTYAYWFAKVKLSPVEQGFLIRQINAMFCHMSFYAYVANLKRPSDFERHVGRLVFSYCADKGWPLPELEGEEGFDRRGLKKRLEQARLEPLFTSGCPIWLNELGSAELKDAWPREREALGQEAKRVIRANTLKCTRDELAHALTQERVVTRPVAGCPTALEVTSNSALFRTKAFKEGMFEQQDAGSQLIGAFLDPKPSERVIDACSGSGGKTLHLAALMQGKGTIIATDTEFWKLQDLKHRARRAGAFNIETRVIDSTKVIKRLYDSADKVLIDAPCSGVGVIRRMPDSKWRDGRERLGEIRKTQMDILERYSKMAKVGGIVVYSTCSILPSENELQIKAFLERNQGKFELIEDKHLMPSGGTDGFYMAKLKRLA